MDLVFQPKKKKQIELVKSYWLTKYVNDDNYLENDWKPEIQVFLDAEGEDAYKNSRLRQGGRMRVITPKEDPDEADYENWILTQWVIVCTVMPEPFRKYVIANSKYTKYLGDFLPDIIANGATEIKTKAEVRRFNRLKTRIQGTDLSLKETKTKLKDALEKGGYSDEWEVKE